MKRTSVKMVWRFSQILMVASMLGVWHVDWWLCTYMPVRVPAHVDVCITPLERLFVEGAEKKRAPARLLLTS